LVVMLIAVVIVGMLAKDALVGYGMLGGSPKAAARDRTTIAPGTTAASDATSPTAMPAAPMERARAVEGMVKQQAEDRARQVDSVAR
jgi:hypothetical protein